MAITTRPATLDDTLFLAWVMQEAARSHLEKGVWDLTFPGPDDQRLESLAAIVGTDQVHFGHWSRFLLAEVDGKPAAALAAYENSKYGGSKLGLGMAEAFNKLGWTEEQMAEIPGRFAPFTSTGYVNHDGRWILEWVATRPEFRGQGLIYRLLLEMLEKGREQGFSEAQVGYLLGNTPAKNAYEKTGFKYVKEYRHSDFEEAFGSPGIASMHQYL